MIHIPILIENNIMNSFIAQVKILTKLVVGMVVEDSVVFVEIRISFFSFDFLAYVDFNLREVVAMKTELSFTLKSLSGLDVGSSKYSSRV